MTRDSLTIDKQTLTELEAKRKLEAPNAKAKPESGDAETIDKK